MSIGYSFLEEVLSKFQISNKELATKLNCTPQAMTEWKDKGVVPLKRAMQIADILDLNTEDAEKLIGVRPLSFHFRTKDRAYVQESQIDDQTRNRVRRIYDRFFSDTVTETKPLIHEIRNEIKNSSRNPFDIADIIRKKLQISDSRLFLRDDFVSILKESGIAHYLLPFKAIGINQTELNAKTALLFYKDNKFSILADSDRTLDEAHFDSVHEFVHVLLDESFESGTELEALIDKIAGALIYPRKVLVEKIFDGNENSKPIRNAEELKRNFYDLADSVNRTISPKGLARAIRDYQLAGEKTDLFIALDGVLHEEYRAKSTTFSQMGGMDIIFSDRKSLEKFYTERVEKFPWMYPLFVKIKEDLTSERIKPSTFADTFYLSTVDAKIIQAEWLSRSSSLKGE